MYDISKNGSTAFHPEKNPEYDMALSSGALKSIFSLCADFQSRAVNGGAGITVTLCWLDGLVSSVTVSEDVLRPLESHLSIHERASANALIESILAGGVYSCSVKQCTDMDSLVSDLSHGCCALIFDSVSKALSFEARTEQSRAISQPTLEKSLKGAKDSFVETLRTNTSLVRRRICSPSLKLIESSVGRKSKTRVAVMFMDGIASMDTVRELTCRLDSMDVDGLLSTGALEEYIVDAPRSPFPQLCHTERPDRFAMYLLDGRIGILVDGIPIGLVLPVTFAEFMKVTGDSNVHFSYSTVLTFLRYAALAIAMYLPAIYVAVAMYHQEMIPTRLLLSIIEAKRDVPFSTAMEVLGMLGAFALLQEAGLRLPNPVGDTVSIIGALIVGQSAVEARVVSPIAIIVVAFSGIACYTLPSQDMGAAVKLSRLSLLIAAIVGGLFGVGIVSCLLVIHLSNIDSFGLNYTAPVSGGAKNGVLKLLVRPPKPTDKLRDPLLKTPDRRRQK